MSSLWLLPSLLLAPLMFWDEFYYHYKRGLPQWERWGHPLDTFTVAACYGWALASTPSLPNQWVYFGLSVFSTLFITKDEWVHSKECGAGESQLHALLFTLHPMVLLGLFHFWSRPEHFPRNIFFCQWLGILCFGLYQLTYWNFIVPNKMTAVNNDFYDDLNDRWYESEDDPIALLRSESQTKNRWVLEKIEAQGLKILDIGCGAGFLSNFLAASSHRVTGVDLSENSLATARKYDKTNSVTYQKADAYALPFEDHSFHVVCAMDFLEHVEDPEKVVAEAMRVLKPGGLFFFHTFNRNPLAYLVIIKLVEWLVPNTPANMHILRLFIRPSELQGMCERQGLRVQGMVGLQPQFLKKAFWQSVWQRRVLPGFQFRITSSLLLSYMGYAKLPQS